MNVLNKYFPKQYKRRGQNGGIEDPDNIVHTVKNNVLTVKDVAQLEGPRLSDVNSDSPRRRFFENKYTTEKEFFNAMKFGLRFGTQHDANGRRIPGSGKRYKGQTPLAALIENGAWNPWNHDDYPWMHPRYFMYPLVLKLNHDTSSSKSVLKTIANSFKKLGFTDAHYI